MKLKIISLKGIEFEGEVQSLNIKTASGEITVLDHHRPLITLLGKGTARIGLGENDLKEIEIESGFLEMDDRNTLSVLMD